MGQNVNLLTLASANSVSICSFVVDKYSFFKNLIQ